MTSSIKTLTSVLTTVLAFCVMACAGMRPNPKFTDPASRHEPPDKPAPSETTESQTNGGYERSVRRPEVRSGVTVRLSQEIESYLGVPYRWGGTNHAGMDCSGFVTTVFENALGIALPRRTRDIFKEGGYITEDELRYGDLVFFEKIENYGVSHVGIYIGNNEFVHASTTNGVTISNLDEQYYRERFVGARKLIPEVH